MNINFSYRSAAEDADDWSQFEDMDAAADVSSCSSAAMMMQQQPLEKLPVFPPQLHPAVSLGVQRVSSCYFSLASQDSVADLLSQFGDESNNVTEDGELDNPHWRQQSGDVLYHDILMHVFTFLNAQSLATFSETARRPNFEVFYFLQLQLQRALLVDPCQEEKHRIEHQISDSVKDDDHIMISSNNISAIAGSSCLSRLAGLDLAQAQGVVDDYAQSNSTLRTMPLSHSLAYMRHVLHRHGFHNQFSKASPSHALASAALLMTVVGAASVMTGDAVALDSFGTELPNMLFRVGFVGSLMRAARQISDTEQRASMRETAEQMARSVQELPAALLLRKEDEHAHGDDIDDHSPHKATNFRFPSLIEMRELLSTTLGKHSTIARRDSQPMLSNPYDHLPSIEEKKEEDEKEEEKEETSFDEQDPPRKLPSGCVGAYFRAIHKAANCVTTIVKERRKARFVALTEEEQRQVAIIFLDACSSDASLSAVQEMIHIIDVDGFFTGSDGSETCALHTAAFHGASSVLDFLCRGMDDSDPRQDGGLCDVNSRDNNGWTALHFAAGANSVPAVQVLARHGAVLDIEANNGYTPLLWALRLSNVSVANGLKKLTNNGTDQNGWISSQPLTTLANRFFSLIPTH